MLAPSLSFRVFLVCASDGVRGHAHFRLPELRDCREVGVIVPGVYALIELSYVIVVRTRSTCKEPTLRKRGSPECQLTPHFCDMFSIE